MASSNMASESEANVQNCKPMQKESTNTREEPANEATNVQIADISVVTKIEVIDDDEEEKNIIEKSEISFLDPDHARDQLEPSGAIRIAISSGGLMIGEQFASDVASYPVEPQIKQTQAIIKTKQSNTPSTSKTKIRPIRPEKTTFKVQLTEAHKKEIVDLAIRLKVWCCFVL